MTTAELRIRTNNVPRELLSGWDLSEAERRELDYVADVDDQDAWCNECDRFFRYRGDIYDTQQFVRIERRAAMTSGFCHGVDDDSPLLEWDGIQTDSFFSGVVVRYLRDEDGYVVVGLATS